VRTASSGDPATDLSTMTVAMARSRGVSRPGRAIVTVIVTVIVTGTHNAAALTLRAMMCTIRGFARERRITS
jgi:hypothetical protein